ncbi:Leucine-rich repeat-containing protein 29 [Merluccius polli]|uniref:Leucine-rich repeat-containing protein 29 n=1 Tax=Merluccius polli TaxID=89951 RepID=A0AA47NW33_MERPO|nr:Leucine-rich repeat-containing protein 29 [Merluccius polli]
MDGMDGDDVPVGTPDLPLEMIVYIMSFLHAWDRKEASAVCRRWYLASQDHRFQKNVSFQFPVSASSVAMIRDLGRRSRCSLVISQLDGSSLSRTLLMEVGQWLGPHLEGLSLPGSSLMEASLLALLPPLRRLDLSGLDSLFMSGAFLSREEQRAAGALCPVRSGGAEPVSPAVPVGPHLQPADLLHAASATPGAGRQPHSLRVRPVPRAAPAGGARDSSALLSLRNLRRLLAEQSSTLVALDLSGTSVTPQSLSTVAQVEGLCLQELCLQGCKELTDYSVELLLQHQVGLVRLDLSGCTELTSRALLAVSRALKDLQHLSMCRDWRLTDKGVAELVSLASLRSLELSECTHLTGAPLVKGLSGPTAAPLERLAVRSCTGIRDVEVSSLAQLCGGTLRELDLTSCVYLTDLSVHAITTYLQALVVLRLGWCKEITDWGLLGREAPAREREGEPEVETGPTFTRTFGNMGFFRPPKSPFPMRPLPVEPTPPTEQKGPSLLALGRLQELDLSSCCLLTDISITQVLRHPELQRLSLSLLPEISDASLAAVASHCPSLTSLSLSHCGRITDAGVAEATLLLARLQHLSLSHCENITDRSLRCLVQHCRRLRTLDVSVCKGISITSVDRLHSHLPFLENVNCRFVGGADLSLTI